MSAVFDLDELAMDRDRAEVEREVERIAVEELNQSGYNISYEAMLLTPHGDPNRIRTQLEAPAVNVPLRPGQEPPTLAQAIIQSRRARRGKPGFYGEQMRRAERGLIRRKMLGAYYIAAGWLESQRILARLGVKQRPTPEQIVDFGLPNGDAIPAKAGRTEVVVINSSNGAERIAGPAAQRALSEEAPALEERFLKRLEKLWNSPQR